ncbi:hypothetical protein EDI_037280, partial [Entamoeba dispar SAW760]
MSRRAGIQLGARRKVEPQTTPKPEDKQPDATPPHPSGEAPVPEHRERKASFLTRPKKGVNTNESEEQDLHTQQPTEKSQQRKGFLSRRSETQNQTNEHGSTTSHEVSGDETKNEQKQSSSQTSEPTEKETHKKRLSFLGRKSFSKRSSTENTGHSSSEHSGTSSLASETTAEEVNRSVNAQIEEENKRLQNEIEELKKKCDAQDSLLKTKMKSEIEAKKKLEILENEKKDLIDKMANGSDGMNKLNNELIQIKSEKESLSNELTQLKSDNEQKETELNQVKQEKEEVL